MSLIVRVGQFFFYFGIASAVLSLLVIATLASLGVPLPDLIHGYAKAFAFSTLTGVLVGYLSGRVLGAFVPALSQASRVWFIITHFLPVYAPLATLVTHTIAMLPLRPELVAGLVTVVNGFSAFALLYYLAVQVGAAPAM